MTRKNITYAFLAVMIIGGWFISNNYLGGVITGAGGSTFILFTLGRHLKNKVAERIDKRVKDILIEDQTIKQ